MPRLLFTKTGDAVWMSHLDLMRLFQRSFKRAGLPLTHTQGYNPRPSVSIALPMSVAVESQCELLDFELEGECVACDEITSRLNDALVPGVRVLQTYESGRKIKEIALLDCLLTLEYDNGINSDGVQIIRELFSRQSLTVEKKGKKGPVEQDIIPMIRSISLKQEDENTLCIQARVCCQNPSLNPLLISAAVERYLPRLKPDHVSCRRLEIFDTTETVFR